MGDPLGQVRAFNFLKEHLSQFSNLRASLNYDTITSESQLAVLCERLSDTRNIAFDTEFVSEDTYYSQLCLIQVATPDDYLAVVDTQVCRELTPFWELLADSDHETIVHAGREELLFSLNSIDRPPANLFDVQIAAGMVGLEYPAGYGSLVSKILRKRLPKGETRTDWRKRPLTKRQLEYALADVEYLEAIRDYLEEQLERLGRREWFRQEMVDWQQMIYDSRGQQRWRRVSGISGLGSRALTIVRELWLWREATAQRLDRPAKRLVRDDLIVEIAKRGKGEESDILAIRGLERSGARRYVAELAECVRRGLDEPAEKVARAPRRDMPPQLSLLGQFLMAALTSLCRRAEIAPSIVGTASDVRELIAHRLGFGANDPADMPKLARGWRADLVGDTLNDVLSGKTSIRIADPLHGEPLEFLNGE